MSNPKRDFIDIARHGPDHLRHLLELTGRVKSGGIPGRPLAGRCLAMVFRKSSTRTRVSTEAGMVQLGGHAIMISDRDSQMGRGESVRDTARVLSRYVDAILVRTFAHEEVVELAHEATVPVINGLTDLLHPCQVLADLFTAIEEFGNDLESLTVAWIGDGNNMANSWLNAAARLGFSLRLACPGGYEPDSDILARAQSLAKVQRVETPAEAAEGAHVVTTDVWASMGQEDGAEREGAGLPWLPGRRFRDGAGALFRYLPPLPSRAPGRGGVGGGDRRSAFPRIPGGREPAARHQGHIAGPDRLNRAAAWRARAAREGRQARG